MLAKIVMLVVFFAVTVGVGLYFRGRAADVSGFVLGGRAVGPWLTAFAYGTSYFSAVVFVGYAGQFGWKFGMSATWIGLGNALIGSLLPWVILGRRTRVMTRHLSSATMPEFFGKRYSSSNLKIAASIIVFIFLIPYTASLYNGLSRLFAMAFNVDFTICIVAMAVLTGVYVIAGGYFATAVNDFIQGIIMLVGIVAVIAAVLSSNGGFMAAIGGLASVEDAAVSTIPGAFASFFGPDPLNLLGVVLLTSLGTWGLPQMVQKFYAIKSEKAIHKGTIISTLFAFVIAGGCYFLGSFGRLYSGSVDIAANGFDSIIPTMLSRFPDLLIGVIIILVLAASMSTLSSLVMASSSTFTLDFLKGHIIKKMGEKKQLITIRLLIVVFIAISAVIAILQYKQGIAFIAQLMGVSWGALAGSFLAPFLYGLYWKRTSKVSVWCSFLFGSLLMIANMLFRGSFPTILQSPINAGAFAMLAGLVIVPVVSMLSRKPDKKLIDDCFSCYDQTVTVKLKTDLGDENGQTV
ncbi:MAG: sodium:solute symporter [Oscillospiraceae bacterium]|jgi:SSS family solute:Na+ symporter|nr:sodium:solute symporter [Oscillospiraceae bacterium]